MALRSRGQGQAVDPFPLARETKIKVPVLGWLEGRVDLDCDEVGSGDHPAAGEREVHLVCGRPVAAGEAGRENPLRLPLEPERLNPIHIHHLPGRHQRHSRGGKRALQGMRAQASHLRVAETVSKRHIVIAGKLTARSPPPEPGLLLPGNAYRAIECPELEEQAVVAGPVRHIDDLAEVVGLPGRPVHADASVCCPVHVAQGGRACMR